MARAPVKKGGWVRGSGLPTKYFVSADSFWVDSYCRFHISVVEIYFTSLNFQNQSVTRS